MVAAISGQIFDSSLAEDYHIRHMFMDMCVLADEETGVVDMTHEVIARRTNMPLEYVRSWIAALEKPDPGSRSPLHSGARLVRLRQDRAWGWKIVNYEAYRRDFIQKAVRLVEAERKRLYRQGLRGEVEPLPSPSASSPEPPVQNMSGTVPGHVLDNDNFGKVEAVKSKVLNAYGMEGHVIWDYRTEQTLADICRRDDPESELSEILRYRNDLKPADRKFTLKNHEMLIKNWDKLLAEARDNHPKARVREPKTSPVSWLGKEIASKLDAGRKAAVML